MEQHITRPVNKKSPVEKLVHRITHEFKKCKYIGDITISDDEYVVLKHFFQYGYKKILESSDHVSVNPLFAVALVQIGIRYYDGKFWPYVKKELNIEKLPVNHQNWIGKSFYKTLITYHKFHVEENEFMNNVLLHCFITKYYANDLFDFLFAYYQIDLERDLSNNTPEKRKNLMQSMAKGENSLRAYKIKKHTADAVSSNERGCKIRVGRILRFMDNALFNDVYPENSQNRIAQLFCIWADQSNKLDIAKKSMNGLTKKGEKRFSTPYIYFDTKAAKLILMLPPQYISLDSEEELPEMSWKITTHNGIINLNVDTDNCVTGCKTEAIKKDFTADCLFENIVIELIKNSKESRKFKIKSDCIRFFDDSWNMVDSISTKYLPVGQAYAFVQRGDILQTDSDAIIDTPQRVLNFDLYHLNLQKGDVIRLPDGRAKSVGKSLEEGLLSQSLISGAYVTSGGNKYSIYHSIPSIFFQMKPSQENGTCVYINSKPSRFDIEKCVRFDLDEVSDGKGYILKLTDYILENGIYEVVVDVPNSRQNRIYKFAYLLDFNFHFENAPYIFQKQGRIIFNTDLDITSTDAHVRKSNNSFTFDIHPDTDFLPFYICCDTKKLLVQIYLPVLKWRFDDNCWNVMPPEEIWYKEFPKFIYIKYPDDTVTFSMTPIMTDDESDEDNSFSLTFEKDKINHWFMCDTRKIESWLGCDEAIRKLMIQFNSNPFVFASVVTRCQVNHFEILENNQARALVFKSNISGLSDCFADIYYENQLLTEKAEITTCGISLNIPFKSGTYKIIYYEWDEDEDDFGFSDYRRFAERAFKYENKHDISNKEIKLQRISEFKAAGTIFFANQYDIANSIKIIDISGDANNFNTFYGTMITLKPETTNISVKIVFIDDEYKKATITFLDDGDYIEFMYDKEQHDIVISQDMALDAVTARKRYISLFPEDFFFYLIMK